MFIFLKKKEKEFINNFMRMIPDMKLKYVSDIGECFVYGFFMDDFHILKVYKEIAW